MSTQQKLIVHVVQHLSPGGLETLALNMLAFASPNYKVMIVSLEGTKTNSIAKWSKLESVKNQLIFLNKQPGLSSRTLIDLYRLLRKLKPAVVHTHHIGPVIYGAIAARLAGIKVLIHTEHDAWHLADIKRRTVQNFVFKTTKPMVVADAILVKKQLNRYFNYQNVSVINNGIDCEKFIRGSKGAARKKFNLGIEKTIIGSAGRLEHVKGHDILISALALMPQHIELVIAGDGRQRAALEHQVERLGLSSRVTFLGLVDDMVSFYQALDLFCLPSRNEGFPLSTLEAQSCDIVTIASDVGATRETLCSQTGVLFESENSHQLATKITTLLEKSHATSPRQFVLQHSDIRDMVRAYELLSMENCA